METICCKELLAISTDGPCVVTIRRWGWSFQTLSCKFPRNAPWSQGNGHAFQNLQMNSMMDKKDSVSVRICATYVQKREGYIHKCKVHEYNGDLSNRSVLYMHYIMSGNVMRSKMWAPVTAAINKMKQRRPGSTCTSHILTIMKVTYRSVSRVWGMKTTTWKQDS